MLKTTLAKVIKKEKETVDTHTYYLETLEEKKMVYEAGQFITLFTYINGEKLARSYSLASSPSWDPNLSITVKRVVEGKVSNYLNDQLKPGSILEISQPQGNFKLTYQADQQRHVVGIAGGSGITPIFSMIKELLLQEPMSRITLIFANRTEKDRIYLDKLQTMEETYGDRFKVYHVLSQPEKSWQGIKGRIDVAKLEALLPIPSQQPDDSLHFLLCGPMGLMATTEEFLTKNYQNERYQLHKESYQPKKDEAASVKKGPKQYKVTFIEKSVAQTVQVPEDQTLLEAAEQEAIDIPYGCCSGMCNMCRVKCTKGSIRMLEDEGLSKEELEEGYVLACVSYPQSDQVTIELDEEAR